MDDRGPRVKTLLRVGVVLAVLAVTALTATLVVQAAARRADRARLEDWQAAAAPVIERAGELRNDLAAYRAGDAIDLVPIRAGLERARRELIAIATPRLIEFGAAHFVNAIQRSLDALGALEDLARGAPDRAGLGARVAAELGEAEVLWRAGEEALRAVRARLGAPEPQRPRT